MNPGDEESVIGGHVGRGGSDHPEVVHWIVGQAAGVEVDCHVIRVLGVGNRCADHGPGALPVILVHGRKLVDRGDGRRRELQDPSSVFGSQLLRANTDPSVVANRNARVWFRRISLPPSRARDSAVEGVAGARGYPACGPGLDVLQEHRPGGGAIGDPELAAVRAVVGQEDHHAAHRSEAGRERAGISRVDVLEEHRPGRRSVASPDLRPGPGAATAGGLEALEEQDSQSGGEVAAPRGGGARSHRTRTGGSAIRRAETGAAGGEAREVESIVDDGEVEGTEPRLDQHRAGVGSVRLPQLQAAGRIRGEKEQHASGDGEVPGR